MILMISKTFLLLIFIICVTDKLYSQKTEHYGWLFWSHDHKLTEKWQLNSDIQLRSADDLLYLGVLLIRPSLGYKITDKQTIAIGYTYFGNWDKEDGIKLYEPEHRIFEQYEIEHAIGEIEMSHRIRWEQRFLIENKFAQRIRYYIQGKLPFSKEKVLEKVTMQHSKMSFF